MRQTTKNLKNERGSVMVLVLMILAVLTVIGISATKTTQVELQLAGNHKLITQSLFHAESGIAVTTAFNCDIPEEYGDSDFHYVDPNYCVNVFIKLDENGDEVLVNDYPELIVESTGYAPNKDHPSCAITVIEATFIRIKSGWEQLEATLYVGGNLTDNGIAHVAEGEYGTSQSQENCEAKWDIITTGDADEGYEASNWTGDYGDYSELHNDEPPFPFDQVFNLYKSRSTTIEKDVSNNLEIGSEDDATEVYYYQADEFKVNNITGWGILLIDGDMVLGGNIEWHGIIMVTGNSSTFDGGGNQTVYGAFLGKGDVTINGTPSFLWDCDVINAIKDKHSIYKMTSWQNKIT